MPSLCATDFRRGAQPNTGLHVIIPVMWLE